MSRHLRHHLAAALQPHHPGQYPATTAVLRLAAPLVRSAPVWTPGPSYVEVLTATVWARPTCDGNAHPVVRTAAADGTSVLSQGIVAATDVVCLGGLTDKPHRISYLAASLITEPAAADHPACAYHRWVSAIEEDLEQRYEQKLWAWSVHGRQLFTAADGLGGFCTTTIIETAPGRQRAHDIAAHAAALSGLLRHLGPGTRLRFRPLGHPAASVLRTRAWHQFTR